MLMTQEYREEIISGAQVAGAKATKDCFFPPWKVNKFYNQGLISVEPGYGDTYLVTVTDPDTGEKADVVVGVPVARKA